MYTLRVWDNTGSEPLFVFADASVQSWSNRINGPGRMAFTLPAGSRNVRNLQKYHQVTLDRRNEAGEDVTEWIGYLESSKKTGDTEHTILCPGMLQFFRKRFTANEETFIGQGSAEAFDLLSDTNGIANGDTGVDAGDGGVTSTKTLTAQGRKDILGMWELIAAAHGAEFEITTDREFRFVPSLGSDKSGTVTLRFRRDGEPGSNVEGIEEGEDGEPMVNRVIGTTTGGGGLSHTWDDPTNQTPNGLAYPILVEVKAFNEAQDIGTLTSMVTAYGQQRANPVTDYQVRPVLAEKRLGTLSGERELTGLVYGDVVPGDLVTCDFVTESGTVQETRRVAEVLVEVDQNMKETVRYTLTKAGIFVTSNYLEYDRAAELTRRIQEVERLLS